MSSRWPQGQQDQRSPYGTTYDEPWAEESDGAQPWPDVSWQDTGWQDPGHGDQGPWASQPGASAAEPWATGAQDYADRLLGAPVRAPAGPQPSDHAGDFQQEWNQSAGGFGDDADYEWFQYLSQGRSA